jgi:hypothetical protein
MGFKSVRRLVRRAVTPVAGMNVLKLLLDAGLPLPGGEGRGEGEMLSNHPSAFLFRFN